MKGLKQMQKAGMLMLAAVAAMMFSGCVAIGRYTGPVQGGTKTTLGLIAIESVSDGYPMIPLYTHFQQGK
jgi:hypothetical protein